MLVKNKVNIGRVIVSNFILFFSVAGISFMVWALHDYFGYTLVSVDWSILGLLGTGLAFVLTSRMAKAYDRWWEARKIWGGIINSSRTFAVKIIAYTCSNKKVDNEWIKGIIKMQIALNYLLNYQLRKGDNASKSQKEGNDEIFRIGKSYTCEKSIYENSNFVTALNLIRSKMIRNGFDLGYYSEFEMLDLQNEVKEYFSLQGKSERIKKTPLLIYYSYFSELFFYIFCGFLPFGLIEKTSVFMIPISLIVTFVYLTILEIGGNSENPFDNRVSDVPLNAMCRTVEIDLLEMINENPPKAFNVEKGIQW